jgi:THO complex subunit 1
MTDLDLDMADTEEEKRQLEEKKSNHVWRGLRLASKSQLSSFDRIEHGKGLEALQPVASSIEATGVDAAPNASEDQGSVVPQDEHPSIVEEQRPGQQNQVTTEPAAS